MAQKSVLVVGGGFYGIVAALEAHKYGYKVTLVEKEDCLMQRASYNNQARVHQGYHYPRSLLTGLRSRINYQAFIDEFSECIYDEFDHYYAIAKDFSHTSSTHFTQFCKLIEAPLEPAPDHIKRLFDTRKIANIYRVKECAFNAKILKELMETKLKQTDIQVCYSTMVTKVQKKDNDLLGADFRTDANEWQEDYHFVLNCTYANLNRLNLDSEKIPLKHEYVELALVQLPDELANIAVTVMDGPFFSCMPFPSQGLHTLTHVRYTPHFHWYDELEKPYRQPQIVEQNTNFEYMLRDSSRFFRPLKAVTYQRSLWEIKTILPKSEESDSRPILVKRSTENPSFVSILGGKIDNIIDVRAKLKEILLGH